MTPGDWLATTATTTAIADRSTTKKLMHDEFVYFLENTNEPKSMNISRPMW